MATLSPVDLIASPAMVVMSTLAVVFVSKCVHVVLPGSKLLIWRRFAKSSDLVAVEPGWHWISPAWQVWGSGPFTGLTDSSHCCPVAGTVITIDPPKTEVRSSDGIPGHLDVAVECQVLEWEPWQVVAMRHTPILPRAKIIIMQWVATTVSTLSVIDLSNYVAVVKCLNQPTALAALNAQLGTVFLEARRVALDADGISLHSNYTATIGKEIELRRAADTLKLQHNMEVDTAEHKHALKEIQLRREAELALLQHKLAMAEARHQQEVKALEMASARAQKTAMTEALAEEAKALIAAGLTPGQVSNIFVTEIAQMGVSKASKVVVGMPLGLAGLQGAHNVFPQTIGKSIDDFDQI